MSMPLVVDMNLSVEWVAELGRHGWSAVHSSTVGDPSAEDSVIVAWARANGYVVFTHDLDFGTMLALTHATGPSVLQVRGQSVLPEDIGPVVITALGCRVPETFFGFCQPSQALGSQRGLFDCHGEAGSQAGTDKEPEKRLSPRLAFEIAS